MCGKYIVRGMCEYVVCDQGLLGGWKLLGLTNFRKSRVAGIAQSVERQALNLGGRGFEPQGW